MAPLTLLTVQMGTEGLMFWTAREDALVRLGISENWGSRLTHVLLENGHRYRVGMPVKINPI